MRKILNVLSLVSVFLVLSVLTQGCNSSNTKKNSTKDSITSKVNKTTDVNVYYFHSTHRCTTCRAVEALAKKTVKEYYGDKVAFISVNREKDKDNPMIKKYKIRWQALLIIKGDKVVDLTTDAFMNTRVNPDKIKKEIKNTIDSMI